MEFQGRITRENGYCLRGVRTLDGGTQTRINGVPVVEVLWSALSAAAENGEEVMITIVPVPVVKSFKC